MPQVHPTALVDPGAKLAEDVKVGPFCSVSSDVEIGAGTVLESNVVIERFTSLGKNCHVSHFAVLGGLPQDLKFKGARSRVEIGDSNMIREFVTINRATGDGEKTTVGNNNLIMAYVHLAHNCVIASNVILANAVNLAGHVMIDDYAIVGGLTPVHQFVRIGKHSFIGGGSRVPQDVPPFVKVAGNPLKTVGLNSVGLQRREFPPDVRLELKRLYRLFYRSGLNVSQAIERIKSDLRDIPQVREFVSFVEQSERGITI